MDEPSRLTPPPAAERYDLAMASFNEGIYDWDVEGGTVYYAPQLRTMLSLTTEQLRTTADWMGRIHADDVPAYRDALRALLKEESARIECEYRLLGGDGRWRWLRHHGIALRDPHGRVQRLVGTTADRPKPKNGKPRR